MKFIFSSSGRGCHKEGGILLGVFVLTFGSSTAAWEGDRVRAADPI